MSHRRHIGSGLAVVTGALAMLGAPAGAAGAATGANLLHNGGAESGAASLHGWDAVTIPGWNVAAGLPTVVRYGDQGFPRGRGGQLFVGGAGGTARLVQTLAPGGPTAIVLGTYDGTVRLLNTRTHRASAPIKVGALPVATAVTR